MSGRPSALLFAGLLLAGPVAAEEAWVGQARDLAQKVPQRLLTVLSAAIEQSGAEGAIGACQVQAPELARQASQASGWQVRRVSLRERNPKAVPDAWERETLQDFDRRAAAGESPATLERWALADDAGQTRQRYMRALPVQPLCLQCHGPAEGLSEGVRQRLQTLYPADHGTGYAVGQIRGAVTLQRVQP
jgi:hypothetical protein